MNIVSGVIASGILAISAHTLWMDRLDTWQEAERSSRNVLTALARDLTSDLNLLDLSLKGAIEGRSAIGFEQLPADLQYRLLFDRSTSASFIGSLLVVDEKGDLVADAGPFIAPRSLNVADRDYFKVHKDDNHIGLYVSRPFESRIGNGELRIGLSRRLSLDAGRFDGVVMGTLPLSQINHLFENLSLGRGSAINIFRSDGVLLARFPFDEKQVDQDFGLSPHVQRLLRRKSGTFESVSPIDGVHRLLSFERLDQYPLVLTVGLSVNEIFAAWKRKALVLGLVTALLCSAVVGLTALFQEELRRRTRAETKLKRLARTDDLTGLPNRRAFREAFDRERRRAVRAGSTLSLLYIDVDWFKSFNDRYGHGRGDEVLRAIAKALEANIRRPQDTAARLGGEEFTVVLAETGLEGAHIVAENIRKAVLALDVVHEASPYQRVTVSIGIASEQPSRGHERSSLQEASDRALYDAKAAGRNCVRGPAANEAGSPGPFLLSAAS